ncbi:molecular chaperone [Pseudomonas coleopterorum]|uniref:molecular chaperone n=1 Tax=Pseudomonas coleopterorum TaxID=1605838 RepID=UPI000F05576A|nr:molecular chaperone [Pseudomonas coleopterorum]MBD8483267.1 molecular chaperone [Pseudomonas coleopterorum]MDY1017874.1 molecular chaperone [Pseudomonas coleopterorum]
MKHLLLLLGLTSISASAAPQLNIGSFYEYFEGNRSTSLKRIYNSGDTAAFVKVSVAELVYDADGKTTEVPLDGLPAEQRSLIASPARVIVPTDGMQQVRLLYRGKRDVERYFRLRFIPVQPETNDGFGLNSEQAKQYNDALSAGVSVLAGYGAIMFVKPAQTKYATQVLHEPGRFRVHNQGNATVVLDHFNDCDMSGEHCVPPTKHHIRPGKELSFEKKSGRLYRFVLEEGQQQRHVEFKG